MDSLLPQPQPHRRIGPRPLPLHLATEGWLLQMSFAGLTPLSSDSQLSRPVQRLAAESVSQNPENYKGDWRQVFETVSFVDALTRQAKVRMDRLMAGIGQYQAHPYRRARTPPPPVWQNGSAVLRDYGGPPGASPALFVPSLVNRAYILDLAQDRSLMCFAAHAGLRSFMLEWGAPNDAEKKFSAEDYVCGVMIPALEHIKTTTGHAPRLVGYCMGGTLTVAAAVLRPDLLSGLALLAAPWDFHADSAASRAFLANFKPLIETMIAAFGYAPVDFLQAMFASLDPTLVGRKFRGFVSRDMNSEAARRFVELEDWLNDGVDLAGPLAREALFDWYGENNTLKNAWTIEGQSIDPARITLPTLAVIPMADRIVPPASALALASRIPHCKIMKIDLGHIGMMAGSSAPKELYEPLADWLKSPSA